MISGSPFCDYFGKRLTHVHFDMVCAISATLHKNAHFTLCCNFLLMNRIDVTKLVVSFQRVAHVGPVKSSICDFLDLNIEPMNRGVEGSRLYMVRH